MKKLIALAVALIMVLALVPMTMAEGPVRVDNEAQLLDALEAGGNIVLGADIEVSAEGSATVKPSDRITIPAGATVNLDLAEHKLSLGPTEYATGNGYFIAVSGTLTVTDSVGGGSIENTYTTRTVAPIKVMPNGTFTLESGTVRGNTCGISVRGNGVLADQPTVVINDGVVVAQTGSGIQGNGSAGQGFSSITINGGEIYTEGKAVDCCGIYHPQYGTLTINGGNINAGTGITMMAGELTITGGTITGSGDDAPIYDTNDGAKGSGAAVCIINNAAYGKNVADVPQEGNLKVTVEAGTLTSEAGYAIDGYTKDGETLDTIGTVAVTGGTLVAPSDKAEAISFTQMTEGVLPAEAVTVAPAVEIQQTIRTIDTTNGNTEVEMNVDPTYTVIIPATVDFGTLAHGTGEAKQAFKVELQQAYIAQNASIAVTVASDFKMEAGTENVSYGLFTNSNEDATQSGTAVTDSYCTFSYTAEAGRGLIANAGATVYGYLTCDLNSIIYAGSYSDTMIFTITYNNAG